MLISVVEYNSNVELALFVVPIPTLPVIVPPDFKKYKFKSGLSAKLVYDINDWFKEIVLVVLTNGLEKVRVASLAFNKVLVSILVYILVIVGGKNAGNPVILP